jgi:hypothetical protein
MESKMAALQIVQTTTRKRFLGKAAWLGHRLLFSFYIFLASGTELYTSKIWEVWTLLSLHRTSVTDKTS